MLASMGLKQALTPSTGVDWIQNAKAIAEISNKEPGNLTGYDCPECLNRGFFYRVDDTGRRYTETCKCTEIRKNLIRIQNSGLSDLLDRYSFQRWQVNTTRQEAILKIAQDFARNPDGWFLVGGTPGTGKTHICTAICGELMKKGIPVRYAMWRDFAVKAKAEIDDSEAYRKLLDPLKTVKCLYIDDFFKVGKGQQPTVGDTNLAFELLNYRYNNSGLITIISTEKTIDDLMDIDEAVGSRIYERCRNYYISTKGEKNWRIR